MNPPNHGESSGLQSSKRQLHGYRKVSKQGADVKDFFGAAKSDVLNMFAWEHPTEAGSQRDVVPVKPDRSQHTPPRKIERHASAYKERSPTKHSKTEPKDIIFNPSPIPPQRTVSRDSNKLGGCAVSANRNFENMVIECTENNAMEGSLGDLTIDASCSDLNESCSNANQPANLKPVRRHNSHDCAHIYGKERLSSSYLKRRQSSHGVQGEYTRRGHNHDNWAPSTYGPRRSTSIGRVPASLHSKSKEDEYEEQMVKLAMELSLHEAEPSHHSRMSNSDNSFASATNASASSGHFIMETPSPMKIRGSSGRRILRSISTDGSGPSNNARRKDWQRSKSYDIPDTHTNLLTTRERDHEKIVNRHPLRPSSFDMHAARKRLMEIAMEKRMLLDVLRLSMNLPATNSITIEDEVAMNDAQEAEFLAEAVKRSMTEL